MKTERFYRSHIFSANFFAVHKSDKPVIIINLQSQIVCFHGISGRDNKFLPDVKGFRYAFNFGLKISAKPPNTQAESTRSGIPRVVIKLEFRP